MSSPPSSLPCEFRHLKHNHIFHYAVDNEGNTLDENALVIDQHGCPLYEHYTNDPLWLYWIIIGPLMLYRLFVTITQCRVALHLVSLRKNNANKSKNTPGKHHHLSFKQHTFCFGLPLTTAFEITHSIVLFLLDFLICFYYQFDPIWAYFLLGLTISTYLMSLTFSCRKLINLGQRILPRSLRSNNISMDNSIVNDKFLALYFFTLVSSESVGALFLLIVAPITYDTQYSTIGLGFQGISVFMGVLILIRQGTRLVTFMRASIENTSGEQNVSTHDSGTITLEQRKNQINKVISRMFNRTLAVFFAGTPSALSLMAVGFIGVPNSWYIVALNMFGSTTSSFASTLMFLPSGMPLLPYFTGKKINRQVDDELGVTSPKSPTADKFVPIQSPPNTTQTFPIEPANE